MALHHTGVLKQKFRWTVEWRDARTWQLIAPQSFVKLDARPSFSFEETLVNCPNSAVYLPGSMNWSESEITYPDIDTDEGAALFFRWVSEQYRESDLACEEKRLATFEPVCAILRLYDGAGNVMELWYLDNAVVTAINFGDPGYSTMPNCELAVTVKYREADYSTPDPASWLKPVTESFSSC